MFKKTAVATLLGCTLLAQMMPAAAAENRYVSYLTSWGLPDVDALTAQLKKSEIDIFMLSFGQWDTEGNITVSDDMLTVPKYNGYWMPQGYVGWTQLKRTNPNKKVVVAFGGQTYEGIWSAISTPAQRDKVAKNLANLLNTRFPVYQKGLNAKEAVGQCLATTWDGKCDYSQYQLAGYTYIDGIDFDFEKAARLTQQENDNLVDLVKRLRALVGKEPLLSLTTYHVGADPENCENPSITANCSYIENARSAHHGEVTQLLKDSKDLFDFFNVMTYDAGKNFNYKVAMQNYANAVGDKSKILVGATINSQWGPEGNFVESKANNMERAAWQAENGYGGFFAWTLGSSTEQTSFANQVSYLNDMVKLAKETQPVTPVDPVTPNEPEQPEAPAVELAVPDVSAGPQLRYIDYNKGAEVKLFVSDKMLKTTAYQVKLNGKYIFSFNKGSAYYSYQSDLGGGVIQLTHGLDTKDGDIITLNVTGSSTIIQKIVVKNGINYIADKAIQSVTVGNGKVSVTISAKEYNQPNRYMVYLNGKYMMESYNGKAYHSSVKKQADRVTFTGSSSVRSGDKIEVRRVSHIPGASSSSFTTIYSNVVK
ncbi:glycoside hydrolase family 18 protein [Erwinia sp. ErVv1]|uniref:glycoside hydrolase family 18 protein n=1 Tax=Erwinia sp. ErVv1 TaxID=1603299 RepID=UPI000836561C|nr:glycoside hydrolase family 18 protein [Erwinia sp. ErVv1]